MANWFKNLFNPVPDDEQDEMREYAPGEEFSEETTPRNGSLSFRSRLARLRKYLDPDGTPQPTMAAEVDALASCVGLSFPTGATLPEKLDIMDEGVLGLKKQSNKPNTNSSANSIGGAIDRMVEELALTVEPNDDSFKKLESIERHLGIDSIKAAEMSLIDRAEVPYKMLFGGNPG